MWFFDIGLNNTELATISLNVTALHPQVTYIIDYFMYLAGICDITNLSKYKEIYTINLF